MRRLPEAFIHYVHARFIDKVLAVPKFVRVRQRTLKADIR
jgi:hypothetical protein